jgi:hypothetical protein
MRQFIKERLKSVQDALLGFSLVNLCLIRTRAGFFFDEHYRFYKQLPLNRASLIALGLNLLLLGIVAWRSIRWVRRRNSPILNRVAGVVACLLLVVPIDFLRTFYFHVTGSQVLTLAVNPILVASILILLFAIWRWPRFVLHIVGITLLILSPGVLVTFGKVAYFCATVHPDPDPPLAPLFEKAATPTRVIWIIYDELDERVAFSERPKDCPLPELDSVCAESLQATNAFPPGGSTAISLPALTTGRYVVKADPVSRTEMNITYADTNAPVGWSTQPTIFSRARALGYNTALVGWYHPYSRLFPSSLNYCAWYPYSPYQQARGETIRASMLNQIWSLISPLQQRRLHIGFYQKTLANARELVKDKRYGLVFLHLPGPHYPGIYDPAKDRFTLTSFSRTRGYFQNLRLTDKTMGILRRDLEQTGQWDRVWLIISADHWWRDARGYDGVLDYRVPFIVNAPGKNPPVTYGASMNTIITQDLILAILHNEVLTPSDVAAWLDAHKPPPAPSYAILPVS